MSETFVIIDQPDRVITAEKEWEYLIIREVEEITTEMLNKSVEGFIFYQVVPYMTYRRVGFVQVYDIIYRKEKTCNEESKSV